MKKEFQIWTYSIILLLSMGTSIAAQSPNPMVDTFDHPKGDLFFTNTDPNDYSVSRTTLANTDLFGNRRQVVLQSSYNEDHEKWLVAAQDSTQGQLLFIAQSDTSQLNERDRIRVQYSNDLSAEPIDLSLYQGYEFSFSDVQGEGTIYASGGFNGNEHYTNWYRVPINSKGQYYYFFENGTRDPEYMEFTHIEYAIEAVSTNFSCTLDQVQMIPTWLNFNQPGIVAVVVSNNWGVRAQQQLVYLQDQFSTNSFQMTLTDALGRYAAFIPHGLYTVSLDPNILAQQGYDPSIPSQILNVVASNSHVLLFHIEYPIPPPQPIITNLNVEVIPSITRTNGFQVIPLVQWQGQKERPFILQYSRNAGKTWDHVLHPSELAHTHEVQSEWFRITYLEEFPNDIRR